MKQYFSFGDIQDILVRVYQRGISTIVTKIFKKSKKRTQQTFNHSFSISIWNMVPLVKQRLNYLASGDDAVVYEQYFINTYLKDKQNLRLLSIGCGEASHELYFAKHGPFELVHGLDLAPTLIAEAQKIAKQEGLENCLFEAKDFATLDTSNRYDVILFHQSLHHFSDFDELYKTILPLLKDSGYLVLNEFVGATRLQWSKKQLNATNVLLKTIPASHRRIFKTPFHKKRVYRPGWWRMILSDPSESINSEALLPKTHQYFKVLEEKKLGGNILHLLLKDIAHNFCDASPLSKNILHNCFKTEDNFIENNPSDFIFGVYQKKK